MGALSRWIPAAAYAALLIWLGRRPPDAIPAGPAGFDKVLHLGAYGVLGFLSAFAARRGAGAGALSCLAVGALDEWSQSNVAGRYPDALDLAADVLGGLIGGFAARWAIARASD
jgi:VanZ family protein